MLRVPGAPLIEGYTNIQLSGGGVCERRRKRNSLVAPILNITEQMGTYSTTRGTYLPPFNMNLTALGKQWSQWTNLPISTYNPLISQASQNNIEPSRAKAALIYWARRCLAFEYFWWWWWRCGNALPTFAARYLNIKGHKIDSKCTWCWCLPLPDLASSVGGGDGDGGAVVATGGGLYIGGVNRASWLENTENHANDSTQYKR